ncbi:amidase [Bradyrhizobium jicamae]|uniref:Indoleacetamide hydrolase n=1 Tax=Bradyrhizobium jicamae TaxID=280332 RepID=A0ABS5FR70_9BRAD|nr:amidase [Bradyrhizobium jicamae]MBR0799283.1 amidase [Bradyrhizobium jicamae]
MLNDHLHFTHRPDGARPSGISIAPVHPSSIVDLGACALADSISSRKTSCLEVVTAHLDRIERINSSYNAIVSIRDREEILTEAREKDALLAGGVRQGWLHGIPQAIKDLASTKGLRTTLGSPLHRDAIPTRDAIFVQRTKRSGAILVGKTNTAEFGLGSQTYNPVFGTTLNAYDRTRTSGGSSGGAAVAVATRMLPVADGSDSAGSIRNPAAYNNLFSLRPTQGRMPSEGRDPNLPSLGTVGPIARSVEDLAMLFSVQVGDEWSPPEPEESSACFRERLARDWDGTRVGWLGDLGGYLPFDAGVLGLCKRAAESFVEIGCVVEPVRVDYRLDELWRDWVALRAWLTGGPLAGRYADPAKRPLMKEEARWEVEQAMRLSALDVLEASARRAEWCRAVQRLFKSYEFLVLPTAQCFPFDARVAWPKEIGGCKMDIYHRWMEVVIYATLVGCPVVNVPAGFSKQGLPMGLQVLGPCHGDLACLQLAYAYEQATRWSSIRPADVMFMTEERTNGCACA